jgi:hypothetical protein
MPSFKEITNDQMEPGTATSISTLLQASGQITKEDVYGFL